MFATAKFNPKHTTHYETLLRFIALVVLLVGYFIYLSWEYDASTGFRVALLSWSFFVLCTPIADGGFIIAFPIRLLFSIKMFITQIVVWFVAVGVNLYMLFSNPTIYEMTFLTQLLNHILTEPYPYWGILIISLLGTLLSIYFGDEMIDVVSHEQRKKQHKLGLKYRIILIVGLAALTITAYYFLLSELNIDLSVFK